MSIGCHASIAEFRAASEGMQVLGLEIVHSYAHTANLAAWARGLSPVLGGISGIGGSALQGELDAFVRLGARLARQQSFS